MSVGQPDQLYQDHEKFQRNLFGCFPYISASHIGCFPILAPIIEKNLSILGAGRWRNWKMYGLAKRRVWENFGNNNLTQRLESLQADSSNLMVFWPHQLSAESLMICRTFITWARDSLPTNIGWCCVSLIRFVDVISSHRREPARYTVLSFKTLGSTLTSLHVSDIQIYISISEGF